MDQQAVFPGWHVEDVRLGELRLRVLAAGNGPVVLLLHGFPDAPTTWRFQRDALVRAGHRVVAPWLRGYGPSDKPRRVRDYSVASLAADAAALITALGERRAAAVVGHDWGGVIAWRLAAERPELLERLIILNAPHPSRFARELWKPDQLLRSTYAVFFQLPWLPEVMLRMRGFALVRRSIARMVRREAAFTREAWQDIRDTLAAPGALEAALSYYRAAGRAMLRGRSGASDPASRIEAPTLVLWGERDEALGPRLSQGLERFVPDVCVRRFPDAGHWVHWDEPDAVTAEILGFLRADLNGST